MRTKKDPAGHRLTNSHDTSLRFRDTIVLYKNKPYHVAEIEGKFKVYASLYSKSVGWHPSEVINIKECETQNFTLGWTMSGPRALYISRVPVRKYKQGLCTSNTYGWCPDSQQSKQIGMSCIANCLLHKYKTFNDAAAGKPGWYILSSEIAIKKEPKSSVLYISGDRAGTINMNDKTIELDIDGLYSVYFEELRKVGIV